MTNEQYPSMDDYHGGGTILNGYTSVNNVVDECRKELVNHWDVFALLADGFEVIINDGEIKATRQIKSGYGRFSVGVHESLG